MDIIEYQLRVKKTQIRMIQDRGYTTTQKDKDFMAMDTSDYKKHLEKTKGSIANSISGYYTRQSDPYNHGYGLNVFVQFMEWDVNKAGKVKTNSKESVKKLIATLKIEYGDELRHIIIITLKGISPSAKSIFESLTNYKMELFEHTELAQIPVDHMLASKYKLLSVKKSKKTRKENNLVLNKLPKYQREDAIVRYYGAQQNDLFEVDNKPFLSGLMFISGPISSMEYMVVI